MSPPAFPGILKGAELPERVLIVDEARLSLPGELDDPLVDDRDPFAKQLRRNADLLDHLAGFEFHLAHDGPSFESGAFV